MAVTIERFAELLARAEIVEQDSASNDLLNRVWDGAQRTRLLKIRHKQILVDQQLILP